MPYLSVVIPVYNSATTINHVVNDCFAALSHLDFELILVNDGSTDKSEEVIFTLAKKHANIKAISLTKNFGEFNAVMCGLNFATGEYTAIIDDDGQNPPTEILKLLAKAEEGYGVVYARYDEKMHSNWRNAGSGFTNAIATIITGKRYNLYLSSFKVIKKNLVQQMVQYTNANVFPDLLVLKHTKKISEVDVLHKSAAVKSRYTLSRLIAVFSAMLITGAGFWGYVLYYLLIAVLLVWIYIPIILFTGGKGGGSGIYMVCIAALVLAILPKTKRDNQYQIKKSSF